MKCPNCKREYTNAKWCEVCGSPLTDDTIVENSSNYSNNQSNTSAFDEPSEIDYPDFIERTLTEDEQASFQEDVADTNVYERTDGDLYDDESVVEDFGDLEETPGRRGVKIALLIIIPIAIIVIAVAALIFTGVINLGSDTEKDSVSDVSDETSEENDEINALLKNGKYYISIGDYESAEAVYKAVIDKDSDCKEASLLYKILYNYNRALKKLESKKFEDAREFYDKIPGNYADYELAGDVEALGDEIVCYETNSARFENLTGFMDDGDYESAKEIIDLIDEDYLSDAQARAIQRYHREIENASEAEKQADEEKDETLPENELTQKDAQILITDYLVAYVRAINEKDFSVVAPYLSGNLYVKQQKEVERRVSLGDTEEFDYVNLHDLRKSDGSKWYADVTESLIVTHADGKEEISVNEFTYTIELIDEKYYLTDIAKAAE